MNQKLERDLTWFLFGRQRFSLDQNGFGKFGNVVLHLWGPHGNRQQMMHRVAAKVLFIKGFFLLGLEGGLSQF